MNHANAETVEQQDATCTEIGYTAGKYCPACKTWIEGHEEVEAKGHTPGEWKVDEEADCTTAGSKHQICSACGETIKIEDIPAKGHNYVDVITDATCTTDGYTTHTCSVCGNGYSDSFVEALDHSFTNYTSNNDATCTSDGTKTAKCDRCDVTDTISDKDSAKGHIEVIFGGITPTCTESGLSDGTRCKICGVVLTEQTVIPAMGHIDNDHDGKCDDCNTELSTQTDPTENCKCNCHKTGIMSFFYKILRFFWKLFGINKVCACGVAHY